MTKLKLVLTLLLFSVFSKSFAQPGSLDASFAGKGLQTYSFKQNVSTESPSATLTDASGNIYITGIESAATGTNPFVVRLLPSGKPDLTFGKGGKLIFTDSISPIQHYTFYPKTMALHSDGDIVIAGCIYDNGGNPSPSIAKMSPAGIFRPLGGKGTYISYSAKVAGANAAFTGVHVLPNGDIVATGDAGLGADFIACKITSSGNPSLFINHDTDVLDISLDIQSDATCSFLKGNLIYMAGNTGGTGSQISVAAFNPVSGDMSATFGSSGQEALTISGNVNDNFCTSIFVNSSNHVILGGSGTDKGTGNNNFLIYQLMPDGIVEFCNSFNLGLSAESYSMAVDASGKILLGGYLQDSGNYDNWTLVRANADGSLDTGFGTGGHLTFPLHPYSPGSGTGVNCLIRHIDGNYLLTGMSSSATDDITIKKVTLNGAPVTTFANNSEYLLWLADAESYITDIAVRSDGEFFVTGTYVSPVNNLKVSVLALIKKDGTLDASFGGTGGADAGTLNISTLAPAAIRDTLELSAIQIQPADNKIILAGSYLNGAIGHDAFILRLSPTGVLETGFNGGLGYNFFNADSSYIHDLAVQSDNKLLAYGYNHGSLTLVRYMNDGTLDASFAVNGTYIHPNTRNMSSKVADDKVELRIQNDQKIVCVGTSYASGSDFLVFRLTTGGSLDVSFGSKNDGIATFDFSGANDRAYALAIKPDGKILAGGYTQPDDANYGIVQFTAAGIADTTFGILKDGSVSITRGYQGHNISHLEVENSNAILASGVVQQAGAPPMQYLSVMRLTGAGILDNTFSGKGHTVFSFGYSKNAILNNGSYYIVAGTNYFTPGAGYKGSGEIVKLKLGAGPVIKSTNLQLTDVLKTFGDDPFQLKPVTNSTAAIQYSIVNGSCGTVNPTTGLVTIKCVPVSPSELIKVKVYQPATYGFTDAQVIVTVNVAKAIPKIIFNPQGGLIDSTILLRAITKETSSGMQFNVIQDPNYILYDLGAGNMTIQGEGCATVQVIVYQTQNYLQGSATASVCGYKTPQAPLAYDDEVTVTYTVDLKANINILANDEGRTGTIEPASVDLDPSTPDVRDTVFVSPAYGRFAVDTFGNVTYTPFQGLIGSGAITYTVSDSYGLVSDPATLTVTQMAGEAPALKATELFTPNKDGLNDAFVIGWIDFKKENKLKVFDRNGQEIFTKNNYRNDWVGDLSNGKEAENGIYYYVFQEGTDSNQRELKGAVELRR